MFILGHGAIDHGAIDHGAIDIVAPCPNAF